MNPTTTTCSRWTYIWLISVLIGLAGLMQSFAEAAVPPKPNIIFIFADDQCHDTIYALGNSEVKTPNLDRLARFGTTFTNTYNMGSWTGAVCVASRTMQNTGRFVWRARHANLGEIMRQEQSWSQLLRNAGYETYMTGKWHVCGLKTAGVPKPDFIEFQSLLPYVNDPNRKSAYDAIYGCYLADLQRMVRVGDWKLIVYPRAKVVRLFNLADDPQEMHDLAANPDQKQRISNLFASLLTLQEQMDASLDLRAVFPDL